MRRSTSEIGNEDTPQSRLWQIIEFGTGLSIPPANPSDSLTGFEARHSSWHAAEPYIEKCEPIKDADTNENIQRDLLRFTVLRLADLALISYRSGKRIPVRLSTVVRRLNPPPGFPPGSHSDQFSLLHRSFDKAGRSENAQARVSGRPSYTPVLSVLSGLAYHLKCETFRSRLSLLAQLFKCVYPPIFILCGQRAAWRQLSDAISKYRRNEDGEKDFQKLSSAMAQALQAPALPSSK